MWMFIVGSLMGFTAAQSANNNDYPSMGGWVPVDAAMFTVNAAWVPRR